MTFFEASTWVIPVIIAITFHEAAHGFVARLFGDDTAWRLGRVSFNPLKHIDPFGTILLPGMLLLLRSPFLFGYAKPVPVNFKALRNPRRGMIWVAAAGPGMNIALATLALGRQKLFPPADSSGVEREYEGPLGHVAVTAVGHWRGELARASSRREAGRSRQRVPW